VEGEIKLINKWTDEIIRKKSVIGSKDYIVKEYHKFAVKYLDPLCSAVIVNIKE